MAFLNEIWREKIGKFFEKISNACRQAKISKNWGFCKDDLCPSKGKKLFVNTGSPKIKYVKILIYN